MGTRLHTVCRFVRLGVVSWALVAMLGGCAVPVAANLEEGDANRVMVALDTAGLDPTKEVDPGAEGRFRISVGRDDAARALAVMADEQLPRAKGRGNDAKGSGSLVPSQAAEHAHIVGAMAAELEHTLGGVEGVLAARVHLNVPARDAFHDGPTPKSTASVLLEHRGSTPPLAPEAVQRLVAGGAPGLGPADVAVVFVPRAARPAAGKADLAHVGPIVVARGSTAALKAALAGLVLVVVALALLSLGLYAKIVRLRTTPTPGPMA